MKGTNESTAGRDVKRLIARLESWQAAGVTHYKKADHRSPQAEDEPCNLSRQNEENPVSNQETLRVQSGLLDIPAEPIPNGPEPRQKLLDIVCREVSACVKCKELASTRTQTVFGVGNPQARLCFMGEAPGADEDRKGEPFVGRAGQLLTKIIEACTLRREEVYILNTIKCRPPGNRNPLPDEVRNCRGYLDRQLEIIRPEFICCLGAVAAQALLDVNTSIGRLRGRFHDYHGINVICTYHPAYLLRNPAAKRQTWDDMKMLMERMGIDLPDGTK